MMYTYTCTIVRVVDGDTVIVDIDLGFGIVLQKESVRLFGIDTPESRTSDKVEKIFGNLAKARVKELLPKGLKTEMRSKSFGKGKYGRIMADFITTDSQSLVDLLLREAHGVPYLGQNKDAIKQLHLRNREILIEHGVTNGEVPG